MRKLVKLVVIVLVCGGVVTCCAAKNETPQAAVNRTARPATHVITTTNDHPTYFMGQPKSEKFRDLVIIETDGYIVGFSEETRTPIWACYRLFDVPNPPQLERPDKDFTTFTSGDVVVRHDDYTNSGYDRGHLAPSSGIGKCYGKQAQVATFTTANICPQHPGLNQRCWERFERLVSDEYAERFDEVYVVTGPVYRDSCIELTSDIRVPDAFFKVVVMQIDGEVEMLGIVMPNERTNQSDIARYIHPVDEIEALTGLDLFHRLDDRIENQAEAEGVNQVHSAWKIMTQLKPSFAGNARKMRTRACD